MRCVHMHNTTADIMYTLVMHELCYGFLLLLYTSAYPVVVWTEIHVLSFLSLTLIFFFVRLPSIVLVFVSVCDSVLFFCLITDRMNGTIEAYSSRRKWRSLTIHISLYIPRFALCEQNILYDALSDRQTTQAEYPLWLVSYASSCSPMLR